jgi:hypothetical protein
VSIVRSVAEAKDAKNVPVKAKKAAKKRAFFIRALVEESSNIVSSAMGSLKMGFPAIRALSNILKGREKTESLEHPTA